MESSAARVTYLKSSPVQELRRILRDQYSIASILSEIVQNADDAGAERIHFAMLNSWPPHVHALLDGPTLLILNDGVFRAVDKDGIARLDEGAKGGEAGSIGKYGLGMKSLFHLCEGIFFAANHVGSEEAPFVSLLNPWEEGGPHDDWQDLESASSAVLDIINRWKHGADRWFSLLIPLRRPEHLSGAEAIVQGQFPKAKDVKERLDTESLVALLPLLRTVREMTVWDGTFEGGFKQLESAGVDDFPKPRRRAYGSPDGKLAPGEECALVFSVSSRSAGSDPILLGSGVERLLADPKFKALQVDPQWPKNYTWDAKHGRRVHVREKGDPHCAVVLTHQPAAENRLSVWNTVFLPLSEGRQARIEGSFRGSYDLLLHGQFFLDAGRHNIYKGNSSEDIQDRWNQLLLKTGVLPLIPKALDAFVRQWEPNPSEIGAITRSLQQSDFFAQNGSNICREYWWVAPLDSGEEPLTWRLVEPPTRYFTFPDLEGRHSLAYRLFGTLSKICEQELVVGISTPILAGAAHTRWRDGGSLLARLLDSVETNVLAEPDALILLTDLLQPEVPLPSEANARMSTKLRAAIADLGIPTFDRAGKAFTSLLEVVPWSWVGVGPLETEALPQFRELNRLDLSVALIPSQLAPSERVSGSSGRRAMPLQDAETVFRWLEDTADQRTLERTSAISLLTVEATGASRQDKFNALGNIRVWLARDGSDGGAALLNWAEMVRLFDDGRLFGSGSPWLSALQKALHSTHLYSLYTPKGSNPFETLFESSDPRTCDADACISLLASQRPPALAKPADRVDLLERLKSGTGSVRKGTAIRYLLHGEPDRVADVDTPLLATPGERSGHLARLAEEALRQLNEEWRWVADDLWRSLTRNELQAYNVTEVDRRVVEDLLRSAGTEWVRDVPLLDSEKVSILVDLQDPVLWRELPLHKTTAGSFASLDSSAAFLASEYHGTPGIEAHATLLDHRGDPELERRYRNAGIQPWTPSAALSVALAYEKPSHFCIEILDALNDAQPRALSSSLLESLRSKEWMVTVEKSPVSPRDVIVIEGLDDEAQRLLADDKLAGAFTSMGDLHPDVREHPALGKLRSLKILPDRRASLELLATCLAEVPEYRVGDLTRFGADSEALEILLNAFSGVSEEVLPVIPILRKLVNAFDGDYQLVADKALPLIRKPLAPELIRSCIASLGGAIAADHHRRTERYRVLASYLAALVHQGEPDALDGLELPNRRGELVPTSQLCRDEEGIDPGSLVDLELVESLPDRPTQRHSHEKVAELDPAQFVSSILVDYVRKWENLAPRGELGAFLALFGDDEEILRAADAFLNPRSVKGVRAQLEWRPVTARGEPVAETVAESMERQRFAFRIADENATISVPNLLGGWFRAPVGGEVDSVFIGSLWPDAPQRYRLPGKRTRVVTLRSFDPRRLPRARRSEVLRNSAMILLKDVYAQRHDVSPWWSGLGEEGQLALDITQAQLLRSAPFYFQQLGERQLAGLNPILREYEELTDLEVELQNSCRVPKKEIKAVQDRLAALPRALESLLTGDAEVQAAVLSRIRAKLSDYQYSAMSVLFELFQNADDAAAELQDMLGNQAPLESGQVEVVFAPEALQIRHWGRPINAFARGLFSPERGRHRGYDKDLKKMLILNASDKSERRGLVTGKFGLGFKSVFFLTDRPQVVSGDLAFEVIAGFFPVPLAPDLGSRLRTDAGGREDARWEATTFYLPLQSDKVDDADRALEEFASLLPILLIFSHHVRACSILRSDVRLDVVMHETVVASGPDGSASIAHSPGYGGSSSLGGMRYLVLRSRSFSMVVALGAKGVRPLPDHTPVLWAGAPTRTPRGGGFCLNGPFELDVGRNQVAESSNNNELSGAFGREMSGTLALLFDAVHSSPVVGEAAASFPEIPSRHFWTSLWRVLAAPAIRNNARLQTLVWDREGLIVSLVASRPVLPTHLPEPFDELTSSQSVSGVVTGILDHNDEIAGAVLSWSAVRNHWQPGCLVSLRRTWKLVGAEEAEGIAKVGIVDAVKAVVGPSSVVGPEEARLLGTVLRRNVIASWQESSEQMAELSQLRHYLGSLKFRTSAYDDALASELLSPNMGGDERKRAAFAPTTHLLESAYEGDAIEFFAVCRKGIAADAPLLAEWARRATTTDARRGAIEYLLNGELADSMASNIRSGSLQNWLGDIPEDLLRDLREDEQIRVRAKLALDWQSFGQSPHVAPPPAVRSRDGALERICNWWDKERERFLTEFQGRVYPQGQFVRIRAVPPDDDDGRIEWLKLFLLSSLQTMGQVQPQQHRDFIEKCDREGWLHAFSVAREEPGRWVEVFLKYVDEQDAELKYYQHMKDLVGLGIIAKYIDEYIEALLAADRATTVSPHDLLAPRTSHLFQGGGADAPPIHPVLGIGQCFLFRELMRNRILQNRQLEPYCYVPFRRTRSVLEKLGCYGLEDESDRLIRSRMIHEFLTDQLGERATFQGAFDIPFVILAGNERVAGQLMPGS